MKAFSVGEYDQPLLYTSFELGFGKSKYLKKLTPKVRGLYRVTSKEFFFDEDEAKEMRRHVDSPNFISNFIKTHREATGKLKRYIKESENIQIKNNTDAKRELQKLVAFIVDYTYFLVAGLILDAPLMERILAKVEFGEVIAHVQPTKKTDIGKELTALSGLSSQVRTYIGKEYGLLDVSEILQRIEKNPSLFKKLQAHAKKYSYLPMFLLSGEPWTLEDYIERTKHISASHKKNLPATTSVSRNIRREVMWVKALNELRAERIELLNKLIWKYTPLWNYFMNVFAITRAQLISLSYREILSGLGSRTLPVSKDELDLRYISYSATNENGEEVFWSSPKNFPQQQKIDAQEIKGLIANKGKAQGRVAVVRGADDFRKLQPGDILVAPLTTPNYVAVMTKAAAIVTDIGGITSHAAVVSRELGKPCIIGTKIATQVLKDGDMVEVDANNGIVRKI